MDRADTLTLFLGDRDGNALFGNVLAALGARGVSQARHRFFAIAPEEDHLAGRETRPFVHQIDETGPVLPNLIEASERLVVDSRLARRLRAHLPEGRTVLALTDDDTARKDVRHAVDQVAVSPEALKTSAVGEGLRRAPLPSMNAVTTTRNWPLRLEFLVDETIQSATLLAQLFDELAAQSVERPLIVVVGEETTEGFAEALDGLSQSRFDVRVTTAGDGEPADVAIDLRRGGTLTAEIDWAQRIRVGTLPTAYLGPRRRQAVGVVGIGGDTISINNLLHDYSATQRFFERSVVALDRQTRIAADVWEALYLNASPPILPAEFWWSGAMLDRLATSDEPITLARLSALRPDDGAVRVRSASLWLRSGAVGAALDEGQAARRAAMAGGPPPTIDAADRDLWRVQAIAPDENRLGELAALKEWVASLPERPGTTPHSRAIPKAGPSAYGATRQFGLDAATIRSWGFDHPDLYWSTDGFTLVYATSPIAGQSGPRLVIEGSLPGGVILQELLVQWRHQPLDGVLEIRGENFRLNAPLPGGGAGPLTLMVTPKFHKVPHQTAGLVVRKVAFEPGEAGLIGAPLQSLWLEKLPVDAASYETEYPHGTPARWVKDSMTFALAPMSPTDGDALWLVVRLMGTVGPPPDYLLADINWSRVQLERLEAPDGLAYCGEIGNLSLDWQSGPLISIDAPGPAMAISSEDGRRAKFLLSGVSVETGALALSDAQLLSATPDANAFETGSWHGLEDFEGTPSRWCQAQSTISLRERWELRPGDHVELSGRFAISEEAVRQLQIEVNGAPVRPTAVDFRTDAWVWRGELEEARPRIVTGVRAVVRPGAVRRLDADDPREAGVYVNSFSLSRASRKDDDRSLEFDPDHPILGALAWEDWGYGLRGYWIGCQAQFEIEVPAGPSQLILAGPAAINADVMEGLEAWCAGNSANRTSLTLCADGTWMAAFAITPMSQPSRVTVALSVPPEAAFDDPDTPVLMISRATVEELAFAEATHD